MNKDCQKVKVLNFLFSFIDHLHSSINLVSNYTITLTLKHYISTLMFHFLTFAADILNLNFQYKKKTHCVTENRAKYRKKVFSLKLLFFL
jgi:hypothetical protein